MTGNGDITIGATYRVPPSALDAIIRALREEGYRTIGPVRGETAVELDEIESAAELPHGVGDAQDAARYRLTERGDGALFGFAAGPQSWKTHLHPPQQRLWRATRDATGIRFDAEPAETAPLAFIGVRACDLAAIGVFDRVFLSAGAADARYRSRREGVFMVAVDCHTPGGTCFCVSQGTGPRAGSGFDLRLVELLDGAGGGDDSGGGGGHRLLLEIGSERGAKLAARLPVEPPAAEDFAAAETAHAHAVAAMGRTMPATDVRRLLAENPEHPRWADVAERCLACGNCTNACPTCFCNTIVDSSDLAGETVERTRLWDSCFSLDFSYVVGGPVRESTASRYRHWITHKLSTWHDQFETSGCVGCGRCITWCPVGIDITEEVAAIAAAPDAGRVSS